MRIGRIGVVATVTMEDGSTVVTPADDRPFDRVVFERRFREEWPPLAEDSTLGVNDDHLLFMAWVQTHRAELAAKSLPVDAFDSWLVDVVGIEIEVVAPDDEEEPSGPPSGAAASTGA